jgi:hypothetical protein
MRFGSAAFRTRFVLVSPVAIGFTGLAGFVAGALVVGLMAFGTNPDASAGESLRVPVASRVEQDTARVETAWTYIADRPAVAGPWPFESAPHAPLGAPGKARPDRLSAPEGWTYDAAERTE